MNFNKRNGFTIIEVILYVALYTIILSLAITLLLNTKNIYYKTIDQKLYSNSVNEAFITIDNICKESTEISVNNTNNSISFKKRVSNNDFLLKILQLENKSLIIKYYTAASDNSLIYNTKNEIISEVDSFKIIRKGKLIYINVSKGGRNFIMCL